MSIELHLNRNVQTAIFFGDDFRTLQSSYIAFHVNILSVIEDMLRLYTILTISMRGMQILLISAKFCDFANHASMQSVNMSSP